MLEHRPVFLTVLGLLVSLSLAAELRSYARPDTGFLLDAAARMLGGAQLYTDVVEINPPLIVLLNVPAVVLGKAVGVSPILVYRVGFTLALLGLLALAGWWLRLVAPEPRTRRPVVLWLAFAYFPLAGQDFGEREHLVLACVVPLLLLAVARALGREVPRGAAVATGLLAGLAFALKPHFLVLWVLLAAYLVFRRRIPFAALLPETAAMTALLAAYGMTVFTLLRSISVWCGCSRCRTVASSTIHSSIYCSPVRARRSPSSLS